MEVRSASVVDPGGLEDLEQWGPAWARAMAEGVSAGRPEPCGRHPEELLAVLRSPSRARSPTALAALRSGRVVGAAQVDLPLLEDTTAAHVGLAVPADERGRGVGTSLLGSVARLALARGRDRLVVRVTRPLRPGAPPEQSDPSWPGSRFAAAAGFRRGPVDVRRDLRLPEDGDRTAHLAALADRARRAGTGYDVHVWAGPTPGPDRDAWAALLAAASADAPSGEHAPAPEVRDADRVAEDEARQSAQGREWLTAVALAPDGSWVGLTRLGWSPWTPERLLQQDAVVLAEHRGRRLGTAVEVAALGAAVERWPGARVVTTWGAASDAPTTAEDGAMGSVPVEVVEPWWGPTTKVLAHVRHGRRER